MRGKIIIGIIVTILCSIGVSLFLYIKPSSSYNITYYGDIKANDQTIIEHALSGTRSDTTGEYVIHHDIHFKENKNNILDLYVRQTQQTDGNQIILEDYQISTGQGNHRLKTFEETILRNNKHKSLGGGGLFSGLDYHISYKTGVFIDITSITGTYTNTLHQKNNYTIIITSNCGLSQYITTTQTCDIQGEILFQLPINTYTQKRSISGTLKKYPIF